MLLLLLSSFMVLETTIGQISKEYNSSTKYEFGKLNPRAPAQVADYQEMIGRCECQSTRLNSDQTWQEPTNMIWEFKYVLNGTAVQDEVWKEGEFYASSMRQYQADSARWVVTYFSYPRVSTSPGVAQGNRTDGEIILDMPQKAPNGMDGISRLTFYDISEVGFKWKGEWSDLAKTFTVPFLKIECKKRK